MSADNREQIGSLISSLWSTISSEIAQERNLSVEKLDEVATELQANLPEDAFKIGLIDQISYKVDYIDNLKNKMGIEVSDDLNLVSYKSLLSGNASHKKGVRDKIAIIYAQGQILLERVTKLKLEMKYLLMQSRKLRKVSE